MATIMSSPKKPAGHKRTASSILKSLVGHKKSFSVSTSPTKPDSPPFLPELSLDVSLEPPRAPFLDDIQYSSPPTPITSVRGSFELFGRPSLDFSRKKEGDTVKGHKKKPSKSKSSIDFHSILRTPKKDKGDKDKTVGSRWRPGSRGRDSIDVPRQEVNKENRGRAQSASAQPSSQSQSPLGALNINSLRQSSQDSPSYQYYSKNQVPQTPTKPSMERPRLERPKSFHPGSATASPFQTELSRHATQNQDMSQQRSFDAGAPSLSKPRPKSSYQPPLLPAANITKGKSSHGRFRGSVDLGKLSLSKTSSSFETLQRPKTAKKSWETLERPKTARSAQLEGKELDEAFERVLEARDIPHNLRAKMRALDNRVKNEFIANEQILEVKADESGSKSVNSSPSKSSLFKRPILSARNSSNDVSADKDENNKSLSPGKRLRPRSRTFGTKDKKKLHEAFGTESPSKKKKSASLKLDPVTLPSTGNVASIFEQGAPSPAHPARSKISADEFVEFLRVAALGPAGKEVDEGMKDVKIETLHKLRLVLRNERLKWVEGFLELGGMENLVDVLNRCMRIEWREEHEDLIMHEVLLCLKALTTSSSALETLNVFAPTLFPALLAMIFDKEHKGPSEFKTRDIVFNLIFTHLLTCPPHLRNERTLQVLSYLSDKPSADIPEFIAAMRKSRPYKTWFTEVYNVTKEVFWIFIHQQNVLAHPEEIPNRHAMTYFEAHCPVERAPVPSAPYVGGVEFEAANYIATHLELINLIIACLPNATARNQFREDMKMSGWEKVMGMALRTCKEKLYGGVHAGLKTWINAAGEDRWDTAMVRMGGPREVPRKKAREPVPQLELNLNVGHEADRGGQVVPWNF